MDRLSVREVRALVALEAHGPMALFEIARALGVPPSSAHGMLTKLMAMDLVAKHDGKYEITEKGRKVLAEVRQIVELPAKPSYEVV